MSVNEKMTAIADAIRGKTGGTAALTLDGMVAAITGITGGGAGSGLAYDMGEFVLDADNVSPGTVPHSLGVSPDFVLVWTDDYVGVTNPDTSYATSLGFVWMNKIMGLDNWFTSAASGEGTTINFTQSKGGTGMNVVKPNSALYTVTESDVSSETFKLVRIGSNCFYRAGTTYQYFVSKAWWSVGGAASAE